MDKDQVNIGRHIQLVAAQLAHADNDEIAAGGRVEANLARQRAGVVRTSRLNGEISEGRDSRHDFIEQGKPIEVTKQDDQHGLLAAPTQSFVEGGGSVCLREAHGRDGLGRWTQGMLSQPFALAGTSRQDAFGVARRSKQTRERAVKGRAIHGLVDAQGLRHSCVFASECVDCTPIVQSTVKIARNLLSSRT